MVPCALAIVLALAADGGKEKPLPAYAKAAQGRWAYGLYIKGKKAGWAIDEIKLAKRGGKDVLETINESVMETLFDGERSRRESKAVICYSLEGEGAIIYARIWRKDDGNELTREA